MTGTSTRDDAALEALVAQVADEFLERQKRGERPDIEEYAARHAGHTIHRSVALFQRIRRRDQYADTARLFRCSGLVNAI